MINFFAGRDLLAATTYQREKIIATNFRSGPHVSTLLPSNLDIAFLYDQENVLEHIFYDLENGLKPLNIYYEHKGHKRTNKTGE